MSLFGKFFERIHGSTEFLASESLNYIINSSQKVNDNLIKLINNDNNSTYSSISFLSQQQGDNDEIPDLSGYDKSGNEVIILETKFWASLTENQPGTYLNRLSANGVLVFICPDLRITSLKGEIIKALNDDGFSYTEDNKKINISNKSILIYSWENILDTFELDIDNTDFSVRSDINQLRGLCERIDNEAFLPINSKDLSPEIPRRILSYQTIISKTIDRLVNELGFSIKNYKKTPQWYGLSRFVDKKPFTMALEVNLEYWSKYADTPIWLELSHDWTWDRTTDLCKLKNRIEKKYSIGDFNTKGRLYYPVYLKTGDTEDMVINSIFEFIKDIYNMYKK